MENRLTETLSEEEPERTCAWSDCDLSSCKQCNVKALVNRLAAYEDTNLTPSEIAERTRQLEESRAERDIAVEDVAKYAKCVHTCAEQDNPDCHVKDNHEWCAKCPAWRYRGTKGEKG